MDKVVGRAIIRSNKKDPKKKIIPIFGLLLLLIVMMGSMMVQGQVYPDVKQPGSISYTTYRVEPGDTLWGIAKENHERSNDDIRTYVDKLMDMNHISDAKKLQAGVLLTIYYIE